MQSFPRAGGGAILLAMMMSPPISRARYQVGQTVLRLCQYLDLPPERICLRAGLSPDMFSGEDRGATIEQVFALWAAVEVEVDKPDMPLDLARFAARIGFAPACFAFACSPDVGTGLERLAKFKPLVGPVLLDSGQVPDGFAVTLRSPDPDLPHPPAMAAFEIVYVMELLRNHTGQDIAALAARLPAGHGLQTALSGYLGCPVDAGPYAELLLPPDVAELALLSRDPALWAVFEPDLRRQLGDLGSIQTLDTRVRQVLLELLPSGQSNADVVATRLNLSKRSLHRRLSEIGIPFQSILNNTRRELALHYLARVDISFDEISFLLGFADPNSFFRAFRGWTGQTPMQCRLDLVGALGGAGRSVGRSVGRSA